MDSDRGILPLRQAAERLLRRMLGPDASFRDGQWEAIAAAVRDRARVLLVQKTGWGKSLVYFIAARLLREAGSGPALLVSPLLSLMRNQIAMAERGGVRALTFNSTNVEEWERIEDELRADACDILLVSPERLGNERFLTQTLRAIGKGIGMFVIDEAHCISDWGHDFRPDYRRVVRILKAAPPSVPVLATTATANDRVVADIADQLGEGLVIQRGPLARPSLRLQVIRLADQAERLAWLAEYLPELPGSGIVYCLTVADCERVASWLVANGIDCPAYHADLETETRVEREQRLLANDVKGLAATVALGMGFDKPDLGFVVHFQRPGSVVSYYQQIGRAGRAVDNAYAILMNGAEDDEIQEYFITSAFPASDKMRAVLAATEDTERGATMGQLQRAVNLPMGRIEQCLKMLEVDGAIVHEGRLYVRTARPWEPQDERWAAIQATRRRELAGMQEFVATGRCLMEFVSKALDDPHAARCGRCASCAGELVSPKVSPERVRAAIRFVRRDNRVIEPRKNWPFDFSDERKGRIPEDVRLAEGRALCVYGDAGWGRAVALGKYARGHYGDELVVASAEMIREVWQPDAAPEWVICVPSLRHPNLVPDFARRLAGMLKLPFRSALIKTAEVPEQKNMENSSYQLANIASSVAVDAAAIQAGPALLVDDIVDSRWTITYCGVLLREAGSGVVHPFALATAAGRTQGQ